MPNYRQIVHDYLPFLSVEKFYCRGIAPAYFFAIVVLSAKTISEKSNFLEKHVLRGHCQNAFGYDIITYYKNLLLPNEGGEGYQGL